ncbi:MAG: NAD(P)/FAD-dependent oxidoreductase [Gemmataceae bacterium]
MSSSTRDVVIVGGGVIGTSCAYYLSLAGWKVTVLERNPFGVGCSYGNCGVVTPSHVLPLTVPGAWRTALSSLIDPSSAFRVKPRLDVSLWGWLLQFARRCNRTDMMKAGHAIQALLNTSRQLYAELIEKEEMDCEWETNGLLFVFQTAAGLEHYAKTNQLLTDSFDMPAVQYDGKELEAFEPALKEGLAGAFHYELDAQLRPDRLLASWREVLRKRGVELVEECELQSIEQAGGQATVLKTSKGEMTAKNYVVATGALTPLLNAELGCKIPIQPGKGYSITMSRPTVCPKYPILFEEHHVAVTPMQSGYRIGSMMEFAGYDEKVDSRRLEALKRGAAVYLKDPFGEATEEEWFGWRPMTYDSVPIIDRCPKMSNVYIAAGHNMLGLSMAPATGRAVAQVLSEEKPHVDLAPYSLARF